jgi:hypothetical protein
MNTQPTIMGLNNIFDIPINININNIHINELFSQISKINIPINHKYSRIKGMECILKSSHYNSIPSEIRENIDETRYSHRLYEFGLNSGRSIKLFIIHMNDNKHNQLNDLFYKIFIWLSVLDDICPKKCSKKLTLFLLLSPFTKTFPLKKHEEIEQIHVNSAFTFSCKENNEIYIYRLEECFKVFVHESFHSFGLDFSDMNIKQQSQIITDNFKSLNINHDYRVYESYCETWAEIINILITVSYHEKIKDFKIAIPIISKFIYYETLWSLFQCCKVLRHHNIQYAYLFNHKYKYVENKTQVFSYFILKMINLVNINDFFVWCRNNNTSMINFNQNQTTVYNYYTFIIEHSKNKELIKGLNIVSNSFQKQNQSLNVIPKNKVAMMKTMRMSLFG